MYVLRAADGGHYILALPNSDAFDFRYTPNISDALQIDSIQRVTALLLQAGHWANGNSDAVVGYYDIIAVGKRLVEIRTVL